MKCIACGTDNNLKDRTANNGRCSQCAHRFVFEPTIMKAPVRFTDPFFAKAIADLSADNTLYFTPGQLYYFINRRLKRKGNLTVLGCLVLYLMLFFFAIIFTTAIFSGASIFFRIMIPAIGLPLFALVMNLLSFGQKTANIRQRRAMATTLQVIGVITLLLGGGANLFIFSAFLGLRISAVWFIFSVLFGIVAIILGYFQKSRLMETAERPLFSIDQLNAWISQWNRVNGMPPTLLSSPRATQTPATINPEITAYSFDRVIVTSSAAIAQMLIANNLHLEHNCAILSITGYPEGIFSTVMEMLRRNPNLTVYALHDASSDGAELLHSLKTSAQWFRDQEIQIVDLGLLPRQIFAQSNYAVYNAATSVKQFTPLSAEVSATLSEDEVQWIDAGNFVELEAFGPQKLLQVIRMGISKSLSLDNDEIMHWDDTWDDGTAFVVTSFG